MELLQKVIFIDIYVCIISQLSYILHVNYKLKFDSFYDLHYLFIAAKLIVVCSLFTVFFSTSHLKRKFKLFCTHI